MSTYTKEPGYIYIETKDDREKYAPKREGDEVWQDMGARWIQPGCPSDPFHDTCIYRRRIAQPAPGWIAMSERKPTYRDLPLWAYNEGWAYKVVLRRSLPFPGESDGPTHWMPAQIPAPPKEPTQEERDREAFDSYWIRGEHGCIASVDLLQAWHAALAYERNRTK